MPICGDQEDSGGCDREWNCIELYSVAINITIKFLTKKKNLRTNENVTSRYLSTVVNTEFVT